jgi:hypothetical protein
MTKHHHTAAPARRARALVLLSAVTLAVAGGGAWLYRRQPAADASAPAAVQAPVRDGVAASPATVAAASGTAPVQADPVLRPPGGASAATPASAAVSAAVAAAMEKLRSPAEALRKVQLALAGGTPDEMLQAAGELQRCSFSVGAPEAMYAMRDRPDQMPEAMKKITQSLGGMNKMIENSQAEARRCQVFDAATLGRRMELFQRAYEGGAEGAAVSYLMALQSPLEKQKADPALVAKLQADIRSAAAVGDPLALQHLSQATGEGARELGVTPGQAAGYKAAWTTIMEERFPGIVAGIEKATAPFTKPASAPALSAAEQAEANALAQKIVDAWRRKRSGG